MINLTAAYHDKIAAHELRPDAAQEAALPVLQAFAESLKNYAPPAPPSVWARLTGRRQAPRPHGLYLYGDVGRGKSMLMDLFFDAAPIKKKRRVHFHQFMLEIQARLNRHQADNAPDILPRVGREIAAETWLLCFDEFHVGNIADAMILGRLFEALFAAGVVIVATSNWPPDALYQNGLQRERFLPFIDLIKSRMTVYQLNGTVDHRFEQTRALPCYFQPLGDEATGKLQEIFTRLSDHIPATPLELPVQGRVLRLARTAKGVGFFTFDELCVAALGSADYLVLAECLHSVLIDGIPVMREERRNETVRFIKLIDALYEAKVKLYLATAEAPEKLAPTGELAFPFQRTLSRLMEMQGETYRQKAHLDA